MRRAAQFLEYAAAAAVFKAAAWLPERCVGPLAGLLAIVLTPVRRKIIEENLGIALEGLAPPERRRLMRANRRSTALLALESARLPRLRPAEILSAATIGPDDLARLEAALENESGTLLATAHFGNWEWAAAWIAAHQAKPVSFVYKPIHNPWIERMVLRDRGRVGMQLVSTRESRPRELVKQLRARGIVGVLLDQDAGRQGTFVPFFGRPASTAMGMAELAARMNLNVLFCFCERVAPCRFRIRVLAAPTPPPELERDEAARRLMLKYHEALEAAIRERPEQYFWMHRRWKTRPPAEGAEGAG